MSDLWFTLPQDMIDYVDAHARRLTNVATDADDGYTRSDAIKFEYSRRGFRGEAAARLYFTRAVRWSLLDGDASAPDFSDFIDVKCRGEVRHKMPVRRKVWFPERAYLLVCGAQHPRYRIVKWCWGHELATPDRWYDPNTGRPAWWVHEDDPIMKPPEVLKEMALARKLSPQRTGSPALT